jgi:acetolactate synthase-1/2/3 large subunit
MTRTGGQLLAAQLVNEGVRHIFGVPGVQLDHAVDGLAGVTDRITFLNTRHEQGAAYAADGYARSGDNVGVCMVVPGPGLLNAAAALSTAYACNSRVVCISGQIPSRTIGKNFGMLHEIPEQSRLLDSFTKWHALATSADEIPELVNEAFAQVRSGRPRPVAVEIPPDLLAAQSAASPRAAATPAAAIMPQADSLEQAVHWLREAKRPVLYTGGGVLAGRASEQLRLLAERLSAPVVMTANGRGALPQSHRLALTTLAGRAVLPTADVVLAIGTRWINGAGASPKVGESTRVILANVDAGDFAPPRTPGLTLLGDARATIEALLDRLGPGTSVGIPQADLAAATAGAETRMRAVQPQYDFVAALRDAIPDDGILVNELTQVGYLARIAYRVEGAGTLIGPGYQGTLGYGFPTSLGVKVANPDRAVVSISGDGGFSFGFQELSTMKKYGIGVVAVVFNDGAFGNVRRTQAEDFDGRFLGTDLVDPDYLKLADAFGLPATRVDTPDGLRSALAAAVASGAGTLIEVQVPDDLPSAWDIIL